MQLTFRSYFAVKLLEPEKNGVKSFTLSDRDLLFVPCLGGGIKIGRYL
jgi:hypothetical protein